MQPFERLRAIARYSGDERALVAEAADCLGEFDDDPAALVVTCRRLLHHHPASGPLWWLCARVLAAPEPSEAAWDAETLTREDRTPERLAALLPFPHDRAIAVLGWPELVAIGLASRPDLEVLVFRDQVDIGECTASDPSHALVEVAALSPGRALVSEGTSDTLGRLARPGLLVWLIAGVGRVLPTRLFDAMLRTLGDAGARGLEVVDVQVADRICGPTGLERPENVGRLVDCPVAPELLRLA